MATSFSSGRSRSTWREPPTMGKQLVNFITCGCESRTLFLAELRQSRTQLIIWWMLSWRQLFRFRTISLEWNVWSKWNLVHMCLMVKGGSLLILRFVGQRSRSQLLNIEQKLDTFFVSARYLKNEMSDLNESWYTHAWWWEEEAYWYWGL